MIAALRGANRVGCSDHYINKVLEHSFTLKQSNCVEVIRIFDVVKTLVANFRRSHRQIKLSRKLQTFSSTRFSGAYCMLVSDI
jgi:pyruvate/oxaloacetate carboxyltransferase